MAYSSPERASADPTTASYHNLTLGTTPSPRLSDLPFTPLDVSFDDLVDQVTVERSGTYLGHAESTVSKLLSSLTSSSRRSYDLVEDDDYEVTDAVTPTLEKHPKANMALQFELPPVDAGQSADVPVRTASISRHLPLNHPIPDLQSIQGAYVKNVERLEESAEKLSLKSSLEGELQRIKQEQKQRERAASQSSHAQSVRSGHQRQVSGRWLAESHSHMNAAVPEDAQSPPARVASLAGSWKSPRSGYGTPDHRSNRIPQLSPPAVPLPKVEAKPLDFDLGFTQTAAMPDLDPRPVWSPSSHDATQVERPTTSGSGDTYQQAKHLFTDFDGVHCSPDRNVRASRRISLMRPPRARDSRAFKEPQPGEEMIYYPAPVPVMLNLPVRLSKFNWSDQEKKRLQALSNIPDDMRKSAAWLANEEGISASKRKSTALPPQLRASAFFDHRGSTQDVQLKDGSAVATLDSILDAAAHAPVSAFTDHPIAGHLGNDFYGAEQSSRKSVQMIKEKTNKRKSSLSNLLVTKRSSGDLSEALARESRVPSVLLSKRDSGDSDEGANIAIGPDEDEMPEEDEHQDEHQDDGEPDHDETHSDSHESQFRPGFSAAPTTLLAELQMRKAQQRLRNRTAADAFPNGMHSTLLELDTVTQLQQKARKQKHVKLAWEDKDMVDKENFDDDDVPLGMLFPEKENRSQVNHNRPLGLMEKKQLEENEPLSHRRARLRGEPLQPPAPLHSPGISQPEEDADKPVLEMPNLGESDHEDDLGESLAQRKQRMRNRKENGTSSDFARHLSSELGLKVEDVNRTEAKTPEIEETLGQRRKRLQAEAHNGAHRNISGGSQVTHPALRPKKSLADVLSANPVGYVNPQESQSAQLQMQQQQARARERDAKYLAAQQADRLHAQASRHQFGYGHQGGLIQAPTPRYEGYQAPHSAMAAPHWPGSNGLVAPPMNSYGYGYPNMTNMMNVQPLMMMGGPPANMPGVQMNYPYGMNQNYGYQSALDLSGGMGPPLDPKQKARIEGWRQGIR